MTVIVVFIALFVVLGSFGAYMGYRAAQWIGTGEVRWWQVKQIGNYVYEEYAEKQINLKTGAARYVKEPDGWWACGHWVHRPTERMRRAE